MISILQVGLKVGFAGFGIAEGGSPESEDTFNVCVDILINNWFYCGQDSGDVEVLVDVGPPNPTDHGGDVAVKM